MSIETPYEEAVERLLIAAERPAHVTAGLSMCEVRQADLKVALMPDIYAHTDGAMGDLAWAMARVAAAEGRPGYADEDLDEIATKQSAGYTPQAHSLLEALERSAVRDHTP